jgi:hypothetical protein
VWGNGLLSFGNKAAEGCLRRFSYLFVRLVHLNPAVVIEEDRCQGVVLLRVLLDLRDVVVQLPERLAFRDRVLLLHPFENHQDFLR